MKTLKVIQDNPNITIAEIKAITGFSERTIKTHQAILKKDGYIQRVGSTKNGHWIINKK